MQKKDLPLIVLLFALMWLWPTVCLKLFPPAPKQDVQPPAAAEEPAVAGAVMSNSAPVAAAVPALVEAATNKPSTAASVPSVATEVQAASAETACHAQSSPQKTSLANKAVDLCISSWGGGLVSATLNEYKMLNTPDSPLLEMDFGAAPSLGYAGIPGLSTNYDFEVTKTGSTIEISRQTDWGLRFVRRMTLTNDYCVNVVDTFINTTGAAIKVPAHSMDVGPMGKVSKEKPGKASMGFLGIDSQAAFGGEKTRHWERDGFLTRSFGSSPGFMCYRGAPTSRLPIERAITTNSETAWVAVKNKFFVQIVMLGEDEPASGMTLRGARLVSDQEQANPDNPAAWPKSASLVQVAASLNYGDRALDANQSFSRQFTYYVGPKKYTALRSIGRDDIMEFGFWAFLCRLLLPTLTWINENLAHNYGVTIIIITILIRILFWPVMRKSTESMKKMQEIQPELKALKEKYGNDQQKFVRKQQELFREKKVNPLGGCLPMLIQIPVFIALFTVLRSAVELRFAHFLWISDLSEAENLLVNTLGFPVNILPVLMTATMVWQQRLTPSGGDPQQQKMMAIMMPTMLFFMFYTMASGLVLYWTTSQVLSIAQLLIKDWTDARAKRATAGASA